MKIKVRLFATLRENRGKELELELIEGLSVLKVLSMLDIRKKDVAILLVNGRDGSADHIVVDGDVLSLFPPVGGG
ncbi:MoaD/ThiS family protein [Clostridia bacterium]|nr:MoaD/ThiS family protein [Clostridia bacterium]